MRRMMVTGEKQGLNGVSQINLWTFILIQIKVPYVLIFHCENQLFVWEGFTLKFI